MGREEIVEQVRKKFERLSGVLDERGRRIDALPFPVEMSLA